MKVHPHWIYKLPWCFPLLNQWLRLSQRLRLGLVACTLACAALLSYNIKLAPFNKPQARVLHDHQATRVANISPLVTTLPTLSSAALYEITMGLINPTVSQQGESSKLTFSADWPTFTNFTNRLAQSSLAPQSYRLTWQTLSERAQTSAEQRLNVDLQLLHGTYRGADRPAMTLPPVSLVTHETLENDASGCPTPPLPRFIIQASWPSRGYIQILIDDRILRLNERDMLKNSWQLLRIGSDSVEFSWHSASLTCTQPKSVTVAI